MVISDITSSTVDIAAMYRGTLKSRFKHTYDQVMVQEVKQLLPQPAKTVRATMSWV